MTMELIGIVLIALLVVVIFQLKKISWWLDIIYDRLTDLNNKIIDPNDNDD